MQLQHTGAGLLPQWSFLFRYCTFCTSCWNTSCAGVISCLTSFWCFSGRRKREKRWLSYLCKKGFHMWERNAAAVSCHTTYWVLYIKWPITSVRGKIKVILSSTPLTFCFSLSYRLWLMELRDLWAAIQGSSGPWRPWGGSCHQQSRPPAPGCGFCWA